MRAKEKIYVTYLGGEDYPHDYMTAEVFDADGEPVEIYVEYVYSEDELAEGYIKPEAEMKAYEEMKADFLKKAAEYGYTEEDFSI